MNKTTKFSIENIKERALTRSKWPIEKKGDLPLVFSPLLKQFPKLAHAFTTRQGGKSRSPFDSFNVGITQAMDEETCLNARQNRIILCQSLNIPAELVTAERLVHSSKVVMLEVAEKPGEVDGIVTKSSMKPLYMTYADCVPIIIYDAAKHILCAVHAGWRGTAGGISQEAVRFMTRECNSQVGDLVSAVGPAIGSCCYPVGLDVVLKLIPTLDDKPEAKAEVEEIAVALKNILLDQTVSTSPLERQPSLEAITEKAWLLIEKLDLVGLFTKGKTQIHLDLKAINAYQMLALNISQVDVTSFCTSCEKDLFYSFRRSYVNNEGATGRQAAVACLL